MKVERAAGPSTVCIAGAGPSGLAAAIVLARRGIPVRVYERAARVGHRFHDDLQGLENWSDPLDIRDELTGLGIEQTWWQHAHSSGELFDHRLRKVDMRSQRRPLFYFVRRGSGLASLDHGLLQQATALGVDVRFGTAARVDQVRIHAGGPTGRPTAIVRGINFATDRPDLACTILSERLAPGGYVYFLVAQGRATLAVVLSSRFREADARLDEAQRVVGRLYDFAIAPDLRRWGGYAAFGIPVSATRAGTLVVGEAAGFQDALLGFGLRSAIVSGALAAAAVADGADYDHAWRDHLLGRLAASAVNRALFDSGPLARAALFGLAWGVPSAEILLRSLYRGTWLHRCLAPWLARQEPLRLP